MRSDPIIQRTLVPFYIITVIFLLPTTMFCAATNMAGQCIPTASAHERQPLPPVP
jgi:hypothetical protein